MSIMRYVLAILGGLYVFKGFMVVGISLLMMYTWIQIDQAPMSVLERTSIQSMFSIAMVGIMGYIAIWTWQVKTYLELLRIEFPKKPELTYKNKAGIECCKTCGTGLGL